MLTFHLTGNTVGGVGAFEVRSSPVLSRPFLVRSVEVLPAGTPTAGQVVDVLVAEDDTFSEVALPTGKSIFTGAIGGSALPTGDQDNGLPVVSEGFEVSPAWWQPTGGVWLKVVTVAFPPAVEVAPLHVVVVIEEFEAAAPPVWPRPPVGPPPVGPPPPDGGGSVPEAPGGPVPAPPSLPPPAPTVPASPPWLRELTLFNCVPRGLVAPRTGAGGGGVYGVCPPSPEGPAPTSSSPLPATLAGASAALAQRWVSRVGR